jgi:hypothetical protein
MRLLLGHGLISSSRSGGPFFWTHRAARGSWEYQEPRGIRWDQPETGVVLRTFSPSKLGAPLARPAITVVSCLKSSSSDSTNSIVRTRFRGRYERPGDVKREECSLKVSQKLE